MNQQFTNLVMQGKINAKNLDPSITITNLLGASDFLVWLSEKLGTREAPTGASIFLGYDNPKVGWFVMQLVSNYFRKERNGKEFGIIICRSKIGTYNLDNPNEHQATCFVVIDTLDAFKNRNEDGELFHITDHILNDKIGYIHEKIKEETKERFEDKTEAQIQEHVNSIMKIIQDNIEIPATLDSAPVMNGRVVFGDPEDGFRARKKTYDNWYRRNNEYKFPKSGSPDAYTVRDFIFEEYGDLVLQGKLTSKILRECDPEIFKPLYSYQTRVRIGNIEGKTKSESRLKAILSDKTPSVREKMLLNLSEAA